MTATRLTRNDRISAFPPAPPDLDRSTLALIRRLMKRDNLGWAAFLKSATAAYDLMYSKH